MAKRKEKKEKKIVFAEDRQRRLLERLGFVQPMFDFYLGPVA